MLDWFNLLALPKPLTIRVPLIAPCAYGACAHRSTPRAQ
jgi:hypothetical protein